jgi:CubicO group peptidase (beta-lactamase class C family)
MSKQTGNLKITKNRLALLICLIANSFLSHTVFAQADIELQQKIERTLKEENVTGAVWSMVDSNGPISAGAAGLKNTATGERLSPQHRVHVGSVTKTLLAVGVLKLVTENRLTLDTPVEQILNGIKVENKWPTHPVRIRHLLDHTSGLENLRVWQMFSEKANPSTPLEFAFKKDPSVLRIRTIPGSRFSYSNMGYTLLGMVIETVTKEPYETYLDKNLLQPLGMSHSTFGFVTQVGENADPNLAMGHLDNGATQAAIPIYLRPAGQFTTTAYDMGLFLRFLMSDGTLHGQTFIHQSLLSAMVKPVGTEAIKAGLDTGYSLGLMKRDRNNVIGYAHSGNIVGYRAMIYLFPQHQKAFFISHNMDSETAKYERFNNILIEALGINKIEPTTNGTMPDDVVDWEGIYIRTASTIELSSYFDVLTGFVRVAQKEDRLIFKPFQKEEILLTPVGGHSFRAGDRVAASHVLYRDEQNKLLISDGFVTYEKSNVFYLLFLWISLIVGCLGILFILLAGIIRFIRKRKAFIKEPLFVPFLSVCCLFIPIPFFLNQSFMALGDLTTASFLTAIVTGFLPLAMLFGCWKYFKNGFSERKKKYELLAVISTLQWLIILSSWGMIPFRLWV